MVAFNINPGLPLTVQHNYSVLRSPRDAGMMQRRAVHPNDIRRYTLTWATIKKAEADSIVSFFDAAGGGGDVLDWVPPPCTGSAIKVRFIEGSLQVSEISATHVSVTFDFEEAYRG